MEVLHTDHPPSISFRCCELLEASIWCKGGTALKEWTHLQVRLNCNILQHKRNRTGGVGQFLCSATIYSVVTRQLLTVANFPCQFGKSAYQHELHHKSQGFVTSILTFP